MTCIVGLKHHGNVWIGADSAGVSGDTLRVRADEKVFRNGPFLIGFTSSFRMGQILRYCFTPPEQDPKLTAEAYLASVWVDAVRECFKKQGFAKEENRVESGGCFLVGYRGELWEIESDYQVGRWVDDYAAVGSGSQVAAGALYATSAVLGKKGNPSARLTTALEAAERFNCEVRRPFIIRRLKGSE